MLKLHFLILFVSIISAAFVGQTWRSQQDFSLERAVDSAVGDWSEDVQPGQQAKYQSQVVKKKINAAETPFVHDCSVLFSGYNWLHLFIPKWFFARGNDRRGLRHVPL